MKMKKSVFWVGIVSVMLIIGFSLTGCATTKVVFDENIPEDQQAVLFVEGGSWDVIEFSGVPVKWFTVSALGSTTVTIPSGQHTVKFNFYWDLSNKFYDKELTADFVAGHKYKFIMRSRDGRNMYFGIYDETIKEFVTPMPI
jgi:hypothetical protein